MLILGRAEEEKVVISVGGKLIEILVVDIRGNRVRLGFTADNDVKIHRHEIHKLIERQKTT